MRDLTAAQERQFDIQTERHFRTQRELPTGRDFRWNTHRFELHGKKGERPIDKLNKNFDEVFPDAPGTPGWLDRNFGPRDDQYYDPSVFSDKTSLFGEKPRWPLPISENPLAFDSSCLSIDEEIALLSAGK
ncbi:MAG: hypothetical protein GY710_08580 [Desulfobacteraceae bacterium]|nr:hypothetical protein [Desulfobacteraceae bacterium]